MMNNTTLIKVFARNGVVDGPPGSFRAEIMEAGCQINVDAEGIIPRSAIRGNGKQLFAVVDTVQYRLLLEQAIENLSGAAGSVERVGFIIDNLNSTNRAAIRGESDFFEASGVALDFSS